MSAIEQKRQWFEELAKVGLTEELFESILAASPQREIVLGYPQDAVEEITVQQNW
jgi:hypothetical protein